MGGYVCVCVFVLAGRVVKSKRKQFYPILVEFGSICISYSLPTHCFSSCLIVIYVLHSQPYYKYVYVRDWIHFKANNIHTLIPVMHVYVSVTFGLTKYSIARNARIKLYFNMVDVIDLSRIPLVATWASKMDFLYSNYQGLVLFKYAFVVLDRKNGWKRKCYHQEKQTY